MRKLLLIAGLFTAASVSVASAADLAPRIFTKAPPAPDNWSGGYVGVSGGFGTGHSTQTDPGPGPLAGGGGGDAGDGSYSVNGGLIGGTIGYNWQALGSPLVLGLEADFQGTSLKNSATVTTILGPTTGEAKVPAFGTVRGRIGYAWDRFMVYGTGGWAYSKTEASVTGPGGSVSDNKWGSGYTLGGGLEWAFAGPWSLKAEYLYVKAKSVDLTLGGTTFSTGDYHYNVVRAGLNYRF